MSFITYTQNFEDVMLWRALKHIKNGFYVDVGANHPIEDSVTKAFYDRGWSGINIEPEKELYELLEADRPKDLNINAAISASVKSIDFFVSNIRGWSTTDKDGFSNLRNKESFSEKRIVPAISLDELCEQHNVKDIHFLKVDVEGAEKDVLESFSFKNIRPWIVVVEATKPTTQIDVSSEWEYILFDNGYLFAYFDGVNKYYVADEYSDLADAFKTPPNVFDEFIRIEQVNAALKESESEAKANEAEAKANEAEAKANEAEAKANRVNQELIKERRDNSELLSQIVNSLDILEKRTQPFRVKIIIKIKSIVLNILQHTFLYLKARPTLLSKVITLISKSKYIEKKVKSLLPLIKTKQEIKDDIVLSENAEKILKDLMVLNK